MSGFLQAAQGFFGRNSGEERQFDFTGTGTVLMQSSEAAVHDPSVLRNIDSQVPLLGQPDLRTLHTRIGQQLQQSQH